MFEARRLLSRSAFEGFCAAFIVLLRCFGMGLLRAAGGCNLLFVSLIGGLMFEYKLLEPFSRSDWLELNTCLGWVVEVEVEAV